MSRVRAVTRRYTTSLRGVGPGQLDVLDSMERGIDTVPELAEDTGRKVSLVYDILLRLRYRRLVQCACPRLARPGSQGGTIPSRWRLTRDGLQVLAAARKAGKL